MSVRAENPKKESPPVLEAAVPLATLAIEDVVYRGEGNANIVVALPNVSRQFHVFVQRVSRIVSIDRY